MAVTNFRSVSPNANHMLWQSRLTQESAVYSSPRAKSVTPELHAAARKFLSKSPLGGYPGYRPNSQMRRFRKRYTGELRALRDAGTVRPCEARRSEELPTFVAHVRGELRAELVRLRRVR